MAIAQRIPADGTSFITAQQNLDPTVNDDSANTGGHGVYSYGAGWVNQTGKTLFICVSPTAGAADWRRAWLAESDGTFVGRIKIRPITSGDTTTILAPTEVGVRLDSGGVPTSTVYVGDGTTQPGKTIAPNLSNYATLNGNNAFTGTNNSFYYGVTFLSSIVVTGGGISISNGNDGGNVYVGGNGLNGNGGSVSLNSVTGGSAGWVNLMASTGSSGFIRFAGSGAVNNMAGVGGITVTSKGSKLCFIYNDAGTKKYFTIDLSSTSNPPIVYSATAP